MRVPVIDTVRHTFLSSIVNEGIRAILNLFNFFSTRTFHTHKKYKAHTSEKNQKRQHFYAHKNIYEEEDCLFDILCFLCALKNT